MVKEMKQLVEEFPIQLEKAIDIAKKSSISVNNNIQNVLISGLGGSGIGATIVSNIVLAECNVPIVINKGYSLPSFVDNNSLVICCSYSGNTEETIMVLNKALEKKAKIVCITSGGKFEQISKQNDLDCIIIDGGMPPRSCLGYSLVQLLYVLKTYNFIKSDIINEIEQSILLLKNNFEEINKKSLELAKHIFDKIPVIYSEEQFEGVAVRYRQQINENSKMLCWHHIIPEMNHNEMVGWRDKNNKLAVLFINNSLDFDRNQQRKKMNHKVINNYTSNIYDIDSKGNTLIQQSFYHIHFADLLSCHLADIRGIDASEIDVIIKLKQELDSNPVV